MKKLSILDKVKIYFLAKRIETDLASYPSVNAVVTSEWLIDKNHPTTHFKLKDGSFIISAKVLYVQTVKMKRPMEMELYRLYNILVYKAGSLDKVIVN